MVCLISIIDDKPDGWIIAKDFDDARRQVMETNNLALSEILKELANRKPGRYSLGVNLWLLIT